MAVCLDEPFLHQSISLQKAHLKDALPAATDQDRSVPPAQSLRLDLTACPCRAAGLWHHTVCEAVGDTPATCVLRVLEPAQPTRVALPGSSGAQLGMYVSVCSGGRPWQLGVLSAAGQANHGR
eukprot:scaffold1536_cov397-Prasinococcus_capsulatus_cf.AAC.9